MLVGGIGVGGGWWLRGVGRGDERCWLPGVGGVRGVAGNERWGGEGRSGMGLA